MRAERAIHAVNAEVVLLVLVKLVFLTGAEVRAVQKLLALHSYLCASIPNCYKVYLCVSATTIGWRDFFHSLFLFCTTSLLIFRPRPAYFRQTDPTDVLKAELVRNNRTEMKA
ncbi:hypothetical protein KP509_23G043300 [Ceratopteris richardii]|uniref:Uncharacterized protein n=1 Tax=Ceratopteris richardii TaxID=49495 RepID=A0A8T2S0Z3_CERRI|nr:hypothetical protein KP509_23G043300 [Ceratopteris richardii]KAH7301791.1 hypothetical protein KP509_23G043300 [Ceratopteris richardii]